MKADTFPVWVSSLLVCPLVGYALLLVRVLSRHRVAPLASLHFPWYLAGQVLHWVVSPFVGSQGLELPVVFVFPHSFLVHQYC